MKEYLKDDIKIVINEYKEVGDIKHILFWESFYKYITIHNINPSLKPLKQELSIRKELNILKDEEKHLIQHLYNEIEFEIKNKLYPKKTYEEISHELYNGTINKQIIENIIIKKIQMATEAITLIDSYKALLYDIYKEASKEKEKFYLLYLKTQTTDNNTFINAVDVLTNETLYEALSIINKRKKYKVQEEEITHIETNDQYLLNIYMNIYESDLMNQKIKKAILQNTHITENIIKNNDAKKSEFINLALYIKNVILHEK